MQADNPIHKTKKTQLKDKNVHDTVHLQFKALVSNRWLCNGASTITNNAHRGKPPGDPRVWRRSRCEKSRRYWRCELSSSPLLVMLPSLSRHQ